jgi:hypothetical protein
VTLPVDALVPSGPSGHVTQPLRHAPASWCASCGSSSPSRPAPRFPGGRGRSSMPSGIRRARDCVNIPSVPPEIAGSSTGKGLLLHSNWSEIHRFSTTLWRKRASGIADIHRGPRVVTTERLLRRVRRAGVAAGARLAGRQPVVEEGRIPVSKPPPTDRSLRSLVVARRQA